MYTFNLKIQQAMRIQPHESNQGINQIIVGQKYQDQQCIIFVFISEIEIVTISVKSFEIIRRRLYIFPFQVIHANLIKYSLYVSMVNLTLALIQLNRDRQILKYGFSMTKSIGITDTISNNKQSILFRQITRYVEQTADQAKLWQTSNGYLMKEDQIIGRQFMQLLNMSNSIDEFKYRQHAEFFPIKYFLSNCNRYLVGCQYAKSTQGMNNIRSRFANWAEIFQTKFRLEINPYWTCYQENKNYLKKDLQGNRIKLEKNKKSQILLIAYYNYQQKSIVISHVVVDYTTKKKQRTINQSNINKKQIDQTKIKYNSEQKIIVSLRNVKRRVSEIKWIGLNQLLYIQEQEYLYYVQFQFDYLQKQTIN